jgi:hypothetical protein
VGSPCRPNQPDAHGQRVAAQAVDEDLMGVSTLFAPQASGRHLMFWEAVLTQGIQIKDGVFNQISDFQIDDEGAVTSPWM